MTAVSTDTQPIRLLGLCGSLRQDSSNLRALRAAQALASTALTLGAEMQIFLALDELPAFSPDRAVTDFPAVAAWVEQMRSCDALIVSSPIYARGYPGALKNALDWLVSTDAFVAKPYALLNASPRSLEIQDTLITVINTMSGVHIETATTTLQLLGQPLTTQEILADQQMSGQIESLLRRLTATL